MRHGQHPQIDKGLLTTTCKLNNLARPFPDAVIVQCDDPIRHLKQGTTSVSPGSIHAEDIGVERRPMKLPQDWPWPPKAYFEAELPGCVRHQRR